MRLSKNQIKQIKKFFIGLDKGIFVDKIYLTNDYGNIRLQVLDGSHISYWELNLGESDIYWKHNEVYKITLNSKEIKNVLKRVKLTSDVEVDVIKNNEDNFLTCSVDGIVTEPMTMSCSDGLVAPQINYKDCPSISLTKKEVDVIKSLKDKVIFKSKNDCLEITNDNIKIMFDREFDVSMACGYTIRYVINVLKRIVDVDGVKLTWGNGESRCWHDGRYMDDVYEINDNPKPLLIEKDNFMGLIAPRLEVEE